MPAVRSPKDFWAGALYTAIGAAAVLIARGYRFGEGARMGAGYFPTVLGGLLMLVGIAALVRSVIRSGSQIGTIAWRPLILVVGGTALFGLLLEPAGSFLALIVLLGVSVFASRQSRADTVTIVTFAGLVGFCILVFVQGLGVPMPILGDWFSE